MSLETTYLFTSLVADLLDDDEGISESSFHSLCLLAENLVNKAYADDLRNRVEATDGRFYFPPS